LIVPDNVLTSMGLGAGARDPGRELDPDLVGRLRMAVNRLARLLRQQTAGEITPSQLSALFTVLRTGPLTLGELAAVERVRPPSMTRIVVALEEAGLMVREVDPRDRRVARMRATDAGRAFGERTRNQRDAWLAERLELLRPSELRDVTRVIALLERLVEPGLPDPHGPRPAPGTRR
jgi:DNA-binding MarR family transcriptional regulator